MTGPFVDAHADPRPAAPARIDDDQRQAVADATIRAFRSHAFHEVTAEVVAAAGDLDVAEVLRAYPDWDELVAAAVQRWYRSRMAPILPVAEQAGAVALLRAVMAANLADPALMRLLSAMPNIAAAPAHPLAERLQTQWLRFYVVVQRAFIRDVELGREPATVDCAHAAEQLIALYEGLQLQALVRPGMRLLATFDRAVAGMRDGWTRTGAPPVWEV